jgi:hypothetical protein
MSRLDFITAELRLDKVADKDDDDDEYNRDYHNFNKKAGKPHFIQGESEAGDVKVRLTEMSERAAEFDGQDWKIRIEVFDFATVR